MAAAGDEAVRDPRLEEPGEVVRTQVLALLGHRWDRTVTTVVAGAGFGKSVAVTQAMRANRLAPRGIEGRISCRWGCEDAVRLVSSAAAALEAPLPPRGSPLGRLQAAVASLAPLPVSLVVDDIESLPMTGANLVGALIDALPSNLHLVLVGRTLPRVGLARLRAAGEVLDIVADDLRFRADEIAGLAAAMGVPVPEEHLGGWPAVIRLSLAAPGRGADDFLWEEVIANLSEEHRAALQALCALGTASPAEIEELTGRKLDVDDFVARVPLLSRDGDRLVAHDLWRPFLTDLGTSESLAGLSERAMSVVRARGDVVATGQLAIRLGDQDALRRSAVDLVRGTIGTPPIEIAADWLAAADGSTATSPQMTMLRCALAHSRSAREPSAAELDALLTTLRVECGPADEAVGLAFATLVAYETGDLGRLLGLSVRAGEVAEIHDDPILEQLVDAVAAAASMYQGDIGAALARLDRPRPGLPKGLRPELVTRLHWHLLLLAGRAADAAAVAAPVGGVTLVGDRPLEAVARWLDGDPSAFDLEREDLGPGRYAGVTDRDRFDFATFVAALAASLPGSDAVDVAVGIITASPFADQTGPDSALTAVGKAAQRCVHHDDAGAAHEIRRFLEQGPLDPLTDAHLRRSLAIPYVCSPELRTRWDAMDLGPSQEQARRIARTLLDARAGDPDEHGPEPLPAVGAALPLPWSVELACRAAAAGRSWGADLGVGLVDWFGPGVLAELSRARSTGDPAVRRGADTVIQAVPARPPATLTIGVLGSTTLRRGDEPIDVPELRRQRVRELLSVLVVERSVARDRVIELLWPEQEPGKGRANLRVTLAHLQSALEPGRPREVPPYFVRASATRLSLAPTSGLAVDLWEVERLLAEATAAGQEGDSETRRALLARAVDQWRGRALPDLDAVDELAPTGAHTERRLVDAALTLGELELVAGGADQAAGRAERVLSADGYDERAHRLAIAARLLAGDRSATAAAVARLQVALDDLGVPPDDRTEVLLRQVEGSGRVRGELVENQVGR